MGTFYFIGIIKNRYGPKEMEMEPKKKDIAIKIRFLWYRLIGFMVDGWLPVRSMNGRFLIGISCK